jgi:hypothetical protein
MRVIALFERVEPVSDDAPDGFCGEEVALGAPVCAAPAGMERVPPIRSPPAPTLPEDRAVPLSGAAPVPVAVPVGFRFGLPGPTGGVRVMAPPEGEEPDREDPEAGFRGDEVEEGVPPCGGVESAPPVPPDDMEPPPVEPPEEPPADPPPEDDPPLD